MNTKTNADYRPQRFQDICGQEEAVQALKLKVGAFRKTGRTVGHVLFTGFSGAGKTTMANVLANELGVGFHSIMGTRIKCWGDFEEYLPSFKENDVFFIDEIHAIPSRVQETLYSLMEDFAYDKATKWWGLVATKAPRFTLVGATTHAGMLNAPLLNRFQSQVELVPYTEPQIAEMIQQAAMRIYGLDMEPLQATKLSRLARRTARQANNLLKNLMEVAEAYVAGRVQPEHLTDGIMVQMCKTCRIDPFIGLDAISRRYLLTLVRDREPLGIKALASMLNEQEVTISSMIEPFLLTNVKVYYHDTEDVEHSMEGPMIRLTKRGRVATAVAEAYLRECQRIQKAFGWFPNEDLTF